MATQDDTIKSRGDLAGLIREAEEAVRFRLDSVDYSHIDPDHADAIAAKFDEVATLAAEYDGDILDDTTHSEKIDKERLKDPDYILNLVDGLRNRIRWADGTVSVIASDPDIDEPLRNACSSAEEHLREAGALLQRLEKFGLVEASGGAA